MIEMVALCGAECESVAHEYLLIALIFRKCSNNCQVLYRYAEFERLSTVDTCSVAKTERSTSMLCCI